MLKELITKARANITTTTWHDPYYIENNILVQELLKCIGCPNDDVISDNLTITRMDRPGYWKYVFKTQAFVLTVQALWGRATCYVW